MSFKLSEICEELNNIQLGFRPEDTDGMHVEEDLSADEAESFKEGYIRDVRSCMAGRRRNDCRGMLVRSAATDAIFSNDPVEAYLAWQLTDSWDFDLEEEYPERYEEIDKSPLMPHAGLPEGFVGPGDRLEYELPNWEVINKVREGLAEEKKRETEEYHSHLRELALDFRRYSAPDVLTFIKQHSDVLLDLLWETSDRRRKPARRPDLPAVKIEEARESIERYLDALVIVPAVRASHGDPSEARQRVRDALRLFCNGGKAPEGKLKAQKYVKGFALDPKVLIKASQLEVRFQKALDAYRLRLEIWQEALKCLSPKVSQLIRPNPQPSFAQKVIAGVIHCFPKKWKEERINGRVVFHPADWDESQAEGFIQIRTKPLIGWGYLLGEFSTTAEAAAFLAVPETQERLKLLGPNWIEEVKRMVFGAYNKARRD